MARLTIALVLLAAAVAGPTRAQDRVYRWVDAQGVVHYSQTEPDKVKAEAMQVREPRQPTPVAANTPPVSPTCQIVLDNRAALMDGKALGKDRDGDGTPDPMIGDELQAAKALNAAQYAKFCQAPQPLPAEASDE